MHAYIHTYRSVSTAYSIDLDEHAGWQDSRTKQSTLQIDVISTLANLRAVKIRGGYFQEGEEGTMLKSVVITAGKGGIRPCCDPRGGVNICQGHDGKDKVKFDCRGSQQVSVSIKSIFPR